MPKIIWMIITLTLCVAFKDGQININTINTMTPKHNLLNNSLDFTGMIPKHKHSNSPIRETMKQAGYRYIAFEPLSGYHILQEIDSGKKEKWFANKHHAGYGIIFKNTHLEFASSTF